MKERPLPFSASMVRAILNGSKTMTRRIVRPPRGYQCPEDFHEYANIVHVAGGWAEASGEYDIDMCCPYGEAGDLLWGRESIAIETVTREYCDHPPLPTDRPWRKIGDGISGEHWELPHYRATDPAPELCCESPRCRCCCEGRPGPHWRSPVHMPRWASRILLEIESIKVERVQDISEEDARAEGVAPCAHGGWDNYLWHGNPSAPDRAVNAWPYQFSNYTDARGSFSSLWESIHGPGAWDANPWVWAITFRKVEKNHKNYAATQPPRRNR